jgi:predicted nucleic acid-binding protein
VHLFLDTNILLSFFHYAGDDLEELKKLIVLIEKGKVRLYIPRQVLSEFGRNREVKIADALKKLKEQRLNLQFPQICKDYGEYNTLRKLQKDYETQHAALLQKLRNDIVNHTLKADAIIAQLFKLAVVIDCGDDLIHKARTRFDLGNPPGKDGSLGDALNWEALMAGVPEKVALYFISDDKDYCSPLDEDSFSEFLSEEWTSRKNSKIIFYKRLSLFFKEHFPDIKLAAELEKELLIEDLAKSGTFARTHSVIAKLASYSDFTAAQLNAIVDAAISNSQIYMIISDEDVYTFLASVITDHEMEIDKDNLETLHSLLYPPKVDDDYESPF